MSNEVKLSSQRWWTRLMNDPARLIDWLEKQYHGEVTAAERIEAFIMTRAEKGSRTYTILATIAQQERWHASWIAELLVVRGLTPRLLVKRERYWEQTLSSITDLESGAAVAAHAEVMRLERIIAIIDDEHSPNDIREVFKKILPQEKFHARAFADIAGEEALERAEASHRNGLAVLGLINLAEIA